MGNQVKWAVVGKGFIFPRHERAILETSGEILITCDIDPSKDADCTDWIKMMCDHRWKQVSHVAVCVPNDLHVPMAWTFAMQGKQVLCEKPLGITSSSVKDLPKNVSVVLQLRHNLRVKEIKDSLVGIDNQIDIVVRTYREESYFGSWKGDPKRSGGILFNMGIHYIDLLEHLLGEPIWIQESEYGPRFAKGKVTFQKGVGTYLIELKTQPGIERRISVNGVTEDLEGATIPLTDNGQVPNLHTRVYQELLAGRGTPVSEALKSINLVERLM